MTGDLDVLVIFDEQMLAHRPEAEDPFLLGRMAKPVKSILDGLGVEAKWNYPVHPGRVTAMHDLLLAEPVPCVRLAAEEAATTDQPNQVHVLSYLEGHGDGTQDIFAADPSVMFFDTHRAAVLSGCR